MNINFNILKNIYQEQDGQDLIEHALVAALIGGGGWHEERRRPARHYV
jgi:hypothetical protein